MDEPALHRSRWLAEDRTSVGTLGLASSDGGHSADGWPSRSTDGQRAAHWCKCARANCNPVGILSASRETHETREPADCGELVVNGAGGAAIPRTSPKLAFPAIATSSVRRTKPTYD